MSEIIPLGSGREKIASSSSSSITGLPLVMSSSDYCNATAILSRNAVSVQWRLLVHTLWRIVYLKEINSCSCCVQRAQSSFTPVTERAHWPASSVLYPTTTGRVATGCHRSLVMRRRHRAGWNWSWSGWWQDRERGRYVRAWFSIKGN